MSKVQFEQVKARFGSKSQQLLKGALTANHAISDEVKRQLSECVHSEHKAKLDLRRAKDKFHETFLNLLNEVRSDWNMLSFKNRNKVFEVARDIAYEHTVKIPKGWTKNTFNNYYATVKRAIIYDVSLEISENRSRYELQEAQTYAEVYLKNERITQEEKMIEGLKNVDMISASEKKKIREKLDRQREQQKNERQARVYELPSFYDTQDKDPLSLSQNGLREIHRWIQQKELLAFMNKSRKIPEAMVIKVIASTLAQYFEASTEEESPIAV